MADVTMSGVTGPSATEAYGFAWAELKRCFLELLLIGVDPTLHRRGVGRRLMDHFIAAARAAKLTRVHLEVRDGNPAVAMYEGMGFEAIGRRRDYYTGADKKRHDAITLSLSL